MASPFKVGLATLKRLGLKAESSMVDDIETADEFSEVMISAHARGGEPLSRCQTGQHPLRPKALCG